jgi:hypothetical protein
MRLSGKLGARYRSTLERQSLREPNPFGRSYPLRFTERFNAGAYDDEQADGLMAVLAFFPELD